VFSYICFGVDGVCLSAPAQTVVWCQPAVSVEANGSVSRKGAALSLAQLPLRIPCCRGTTGRQKRRQVKAGSGGEPGVPGSCTTSQQKAPAQLPHLASSTAVLRSKRLKQGKQRLLPSSAAVRVSPVICFFITLCVCLESEFCT